MAPTLRVPTNESSTFLNREALLGIAVGLAIPLVGAGATPGVLAFLGFNAASAALGGLVGGFVGKSRMDRESQEGKEISSPTFWNKTALTGGLLGVAFWGSLTALGIVGAVATGGALAPLMI